ncbi:RNA-binding protein 48 [Bienertia sinuspersici]
MPRYKDEPPAVRVYTVCDESKYLIVRNVPALGCGDELRQLFATYGDVEECKPMDAEECEQFTDVYWIKFHLISNARFAKRKLDESVFLGNRLQVSYGTQYESLSDTKEKLEGRRKEVLARLKPGRSRGHEIQCEDASNHPLSLRTPSQVPQQLDLKQEWSTKDMSELSKVHNSSITRVSSDQDYFPSPSMNETVRRVRDKLDKIESSSSSVQSGSASKKLRVDNRRRI